MRKQLAIATLLLAITAPAWAQEPEEGMCGRILYDEAGNPLSGDDPSLHILELTRAPGKFNPPPATGGKLAGFYCLRSDLVPAANDWKVLAAGYPFSIFARIDGKVQILHQESENGAMRIGWAGPKVLGQALADRVQAYAREAQKHFDAAMAQQ